MQPDSWAIGQKDGGIWAAAVGSQSTIRQSDGLLRRRQALAWSGGLALAMLLGGCAGVAPSAFSLSPRQLEDLLRRLFPYQQKLAGLVDLKLQSPQLRLQPERNRLGTGLQLELIERLSGQRLSGGMDLDYGLRFDPEQGAIRMVDVQVNRLQLDQLQAAQGELLQKYAPRMASALLEGTVLYRLPEQRLAMVRKLGLDVGALRVQSDGLHMDLSRGAGR